MADYSDEFDSKDGDFIWSVSAPDSMKKEFLLSGDNEDGGEGGSIVNRKKSFWVSVVSFLLLMFSVTSLVSLSVIIASLAIYAARKLAM